MKHPARFALRGLLAASSLVALAFPLCATGASAKSRSSAGGRSTSSRGTTSLSRPPGPRADLSHEITGGKGPFIAAAQTPDLKRAGYVQHEYLAAGTATSYRAKGKLTHDGRWKLAPADRAKYRTRILVRRPAKASHFSGTVVVEWLNVSGGVDADPDYQSLQEEVTRSGDIWVGVSAQLIGVMGGKVLVSAPGGEGLAGKGLRKIDPARYGSLEHPGDGYSYDIFTQVARALRRGGRPLGGKRPKDLLAVGESQSAFAMVTYLDGVQPLTYAFDGFLVHSRGAAGLPVDVGPGKSADIAGSVGGQSAIFRTDQRVPVLDIQTESDVTGVLDSSAAHQRDSRHLRLWEVAGTAHADAHLLGPVASSVDCGVPINNGPMHVVAKAAFHALKRWVRTGHAPRKARRIELTHGAKPAVRRNRDGIAEGGIRTPPVDVPVDVLSGAPGPSSSLLCILLGSTRPLPRARLAQLYPSRGAYLDKYRAAVDKVTKQGFVLRADRKALMAYAQPSRIPD